MITNDAGEIIDFMIIKGNVDDRKPLEFKQFIKKLYSKLFADKGYAHEQVGIWDYKIGR